MPEKPLASRRSDIKWSEHTSLGELNPNYGGGKYIDDKGYVRILYPEHPANIKGYIYEHRAVMEVYLSRYLQPWETVHHINEVKVDNRIENLFLCTHPEHSAIHREGKRPSQEHRDKLRANMKQRKKLVKKTMKKKQAIPAKKSQSD
jgi:hypothetical protein